jgi:hypothetical protein
LIFDSAIAIYVADEENSLETVWKAVDVIKILGRYHYYVPVDRELSEGFFISFVLRSNSPSQLYEEIGSPDVDESGYAYYKISDNRYVECWLLGDKLDAFWVVDSEERLLAQPTASAMWRCQPTTPQTAIR